MGLWEHHYQPNPLYIMMGENDDVPHKIAIEMVMVNRYSPNDISLTYSK
jgi:hypothetical protein